MTEIKVVDNRKVRLSEDKIDSYYSILRPHKDGKIIKKVDREKIDSCSYIWNSDSDTELDQIDKEFLGGKFKDTISAYSYHSYGYALLFKPDLLEVIKLLSQILPLDKHEGVKRIFVTSGDASIYNEDYHIAKTTFTICK